MRGWWALWVLCMGLAQAETHTEHKIIPPLYQTIAAAYEVPPALFYAVALVETRQYLDTLERSRPWPWTLNIEGQSHFYPTQAAALRSLQAYLATGKESIAIGLMQLYWRWHKDKFVQPAHALDPIRNLNEGAAYLQEMYRVADGDWWRAVGYYHTRAQDAKGRAMAEAYRQQVHAQWVKVQRAQTPTTYAARVTPIIADRR